MLVEGIAAAQRGERAAGRGAVQIGVVVDEHGLQRVPGPDPAVALDAVQEEFARAELHRAGGDAVDRVQALVLAGEGGAPGQAVVLLLQPRGRKVGRAVHADKAHRARGQADLLARAQERARIPGFALLAGERLRGGFAVVDGVGAGCGAGQVQEAEDLPAKVDQSLFRPSGRGEGARGQAVVHGPLVGRAERGRPPAGDEVHVVFAGEEAPVRLHVPLQVERRQRIQAHHRDREHVAARGQGDLLRAVRDGRAVDADVGLALGKEARAARRVQGVRPAEGDGARGRVHAPDRGTGHAVLLAAHLHAAAQVDGKVVRKPDPVCHGASPFLSSRAPAPQGGSPWGGRWACGPGSAWRGTCGPGRNSPCSGRAPRRGS